MPPPRNPVGPADNDDEVDGDLNNLEGPQVFTGKRARASTKVEASKDGEGFEDDSDEEGEDGKEQGDDEDYAGSGAFPP